MAEKIIERSLTEELKQSYINYAMSVIVSRALPDVRDGFKPVHRRILYVMSTLGLLHNTPFKKCATVVGQVISSFHPHGDAAIYDSLVRMAQDFSLRYPLIDGQGNFGSLDGDRAAAYRYTEARMAKISDEMLKDLQKDTIDFKPNFDETRKEPTVVPSAVPNLLLNGSSGIAVGMATNIPPHNLSEVVDAIIYYIGNKEAVLDDLMKYIQAPDFPTGGIIHGTAGIKEAYATGRGSFPLRGKLTIETLKNSREVIVITEIPYQVNKAEMIKRTAELVKNDVIRGPSEIRDESDRHGVRVVIELKRDVNTQTVINLLYKHTPLEINYNVNAVALVSETPKTLSLVELIKYFYDHRFEVTTRRIKFDLKKAEERIHIVSGFLHKALPNIDAVIKVIRSSTNVKMAKEGLIKQFEFSANQAQAVLDMRLARLVQLEVDKLQAEYEELEKAIRTFKDLLAHPEKIDNLLITELEVIKKTYGDARRTAIIDEEKVVLDLEAFIHKDDVIVSLTYSGYLKRIPLTTYRQQRRGGMGIKGTSATRDEDALSLMTVANTHDLLFFITNKGRAYYLKTHELPATTRTARGLHIKNFIALKTDEKVKAMLRLSDWDADKDFVIITHLGKAKRTAIKDFVNAKRNGIMAITLKHNDEVVDVIEVNDSKDEDLMFFTKNGLALRTAVSGIRKMGRAAAGVNAMRLREHDSIISLIKVSRDEKLLAVSERGIGKKFDFSEFNAKGRGGIGQRYMRVDEKTGAICTVISMIKAGHVLFTTASGNIIRLSENNIPLFSRNARGVKLVTLKNDTDQVLEATQADSTLIDNDDDDVEKLLPPTENNDET
ncbi:DNA gyrase subunit A [Spirochaetota bacterium]|nr:DNA gyrase subunit A [Spirochaetota bacterium]